MGAQELIACFQHTMDMTRQGILAEETARAAASSVVYKEGFLSSRLYAMAETAVQVVESTTFAAAKQNLRHGKVAVLNFANPHYPGGGVRSGAMAQEECLCRSSNLYACLSAEQVAAAYYQYHREQTDYFFSDRLIYTKKVTVFKDDSTVPQLMPREDWFQVDVITCAAPYIAKRKYTNRAALKETFRSRIRNILEAAIDNEVDVLILGAFGCGAFRNPPEVVTKAFREVLTESRYRRAFRRIVFAIKSTEPRGNCPNLAAFVAEFLDASEGRLRPSAPGGTDVRMPGGRVLRAGPDSQKYQEWKQQNPWFGKQFSILGDSISTLEGFNPRGYSVFYQGDACEKTGVREMKDTWWGKVIDFFGGELLVNDAWSGSRVTALTEQGDPFPAGCSGRRTGSLHIGSVMPDVIIVYMGLNDWASGVALSGDGVNTFQGAYRTMLRKVRQNYPGAEVWCCTLNETYMRSDPAFTFPKAYGGVDISAYNDVIRAVAKEYGSRLLDLHSVDLPYDAVDGTHPTVEGMDALAVLMIRSVADVSGRAFLDCEAGRHDNMELQCPDGGFKYVCKRCGHVYVRPHEERKAAPAPAPVTERPEEDVLQLYVRQTGQTVRFQGGKIFAGRSKDCDLQLSSGYVARYQATFVCRDKTWYVRDNNSMNGTYLNGTRLEPGVEVALKANDVIGFAKVEEVVFRPIGK